MKIQIIIAGFCLGLTHTLLAQTPTPLKYPVTPLSNQSDVYFGETVKDPYRGLENDTSKQTLAWVEQQNKLTFSYLESLPDREQIQKRLTGLWNYERMSVPMIVGDKYLFWKNNGTQNQDVLYEQKISDTKGDIQVVLDPNTLSKDGTTSVSGISVSNNNRLMAFTTSVGGSDWNEIRLMSLPDKQMLGDKIEWVKFSNIAWVRTGFFYSAYDAPKNGSKLSKANEYHKVYFHAIGSDQKEDKVIFEDKKNPKRNFSAVVSKDEKYIIIFESQSTHGVSVYVADLKNGEPAEFVKLVDGFEHDFQFIDHIDGFLYFTTNFEAPKYQVVITPAHEPGRWKTIIPEKEQVLENVQVGGGQLIAKYLVHAISKLEIYSYKGAKIRDVQVAGGTIGAISSKKDADEMFFSFTTFTRPTSIMRYNLNTGKESIFQTPQVKFNPDNFITEQTFYISGNHKIPLFLVYKKGMERNGNNPTFLYGYGGFNISLTPSFSPDRILFLEQGGVYAQACLRGGGEYGEEWHQMGTKLQKQNVFDDFIQAAKFLMEEKITNPEKLAIHGRSNGGLLVGACMTQQPHLFKVALPGVGVLDMLRYHKFTIGWAWADDYGTSDKIEEYKALRKYSPIHNVKPNAYPATLVTTADHDDRVVPAHSYKFISALQANQTGKLPVLIRIDKMAGHGAGKPTSKKIEEWTDIWAFVFYHLGVKIAE